jgi:3',5'-cyclic AMP phosphodiesterase CpdA
MRRIAHLSDLHFGRIDEALPAALVRALDLAKPDLVVVSGDMTQRARVGEFVEAGAFLAELPKPQLLVPGNHDIPFYNVLMRAVRPLHRYRKYISNDVEPTFFDEELAVIGVNTARSLAFKSGRINQLQVARSCRRLASTDENTTRILVTHHPFEGVADEDRSGSVGRAAMAIESFSKCRVDLILSGHLHGHRIGSSASRVMVDGHASLLVQAGTATSSRRRSQPNSFNMITIDRPDLVLECWTWDGPARTFGLASATRFAEGPTGWRRSGEK